jgi:hypothetical protein
MQFLRTRSLSRSNKNKQYQWINLKPSMLYVQYTSIKISIWNLFIFLRASQDPHVCHCSALHELCFLSKSVRYRTDSCIIGQNSTRSTIYAVISIFYFGFLLCVGFLLLLVLVIRVLVFTLVCIVCTVFLYCFVYVCFLTCFVCTATE